MDYHTDWKDFNKQAVGITAIALLLCGSLYYFLATAFVNANFLQHKFHHDNTDQTLAN